MKTRFLIIIGIVVASVVIGSAYAVSIQTRCEDLLEETHYPRPLTFWNCYEYLQIVDNPPRKTATISEPEQKTSNFSQRYHVSILQNLKTMNDYVYPDFITIGLGQQVTWSNYDKIVHTITSNDPAHMWSTGPILPGGYATITFDETGIYEYHGKPWTNGVIIVMDDEGEILASKFSNVFGHTSPLMYKKSSTPVFLYDNCERFAYWLTEQGKEKIPLPEHYLEHPSWGNQIFPLVEFCNNIGELKTVKDKPIRWEFNVEVDTIGSDSSPIPDLVVNRDNDGNLTKYVCPANQTYNQILFKCVISCDDDLVYNGYTDSCTTEFELKYHGFCNEEFTYNPSLHTCYSNNGVSQIPLKDPPRTAPPEPKPYLESIIVEIPFDQTIQYADLELYFYDIEDSRCPTDVTCIWEGKVTAMIHVKNQTHKISGYFTPNHSVNYIAPYSVTMVDIQPHPVSTEKPDYVVTLEIKKLE